MSRRSIIHAGLRESIKAARRCARAFVVVRPSEAIVLRHRQTPLGICSQYDAKIVEILDKRSVSFVSVTQQFNTTTSMGRLTHNVLLSFAQFEREVSGERIREDRCLETEGGEEGDAR